jgi:hypothetical protein
MSSYMTREKRESKHHREGNYARKKLKMICKGIKEALKKNLRRIKETLKRLTKK